MGLGCESLGPHIRHPDLQWPEATLSHPSSVLADSLPHRHGVMLHVTLSSEPPNSRADTAAAGRLLSFVRRVSFTCKDDRAAYERGRGMRSDGRDGGRRQLQIVAAALAAIPFLSGLAGMVAGPSTLPGDNSRLEPSADSEYRFASTFWFAAAPVIWSTVPHIDKQGPRLRAVCSVVFLGGLARLMSWRRTGRPHPLFVGAIALELIGMPLLVAWQANVDRRSR
jgi:hypothetical protein